jgi:hypothetical protein
MAASELILTNGANPSVAPAAGKTDIYASFSPKRPSFLDDAGINICLNGGEGTAFSSPADPSGTTSTTGVMKGLVSGIPNFWSAHVTGKMLVIIMGWISNDTSGDGAQVQIRFGTGLGPANNAALTGTTIGTLVKFIAASAGQKVPFMLIAINTGMALNTNFWIDVGLAAITGGTATIGGISQCVLEI